MKNGYQYRIEVRPVPVQDGAQSEAPLVFRHANHDDLMMIVERIRQSTGLDPDSAASMAIGLKLLGSVMLSEKNNPLFDCLRLPMREFIGNLKALAPPMGTSG
jgi:hypothetical protein